MSDSPRSLSATRRDPPVTLSHYPSRSPAPRGAPSSPPDPTGRPPALPARPTTPQACVVRCSCCSPGAVVPLASAHHAAPLRAHTHLGHDHHGAPFAPSPPFSSLTQQSRAPATRYGANGRYAPSSHMHEPILTGPQDMQCVENCGDPNPARHVLYEQPVWQTLQMFRASIITSSL